MDSTALLLPRIQFGFTISFIIFSAFTIGLAPWLTVLEALHLRTGRPVHQTLFEFWLKSFGVAFGLSVVSGAHHLRRDLVGRLPLAYATLMSAFYIPVIIMLLGLILRGVAFQFRGKTRRLRWIWDLSFAGGSLVASFMQGVTVGALAEGLRLTNGEYSGGVFGWLSSFSVLCCFGLCLGYALLGASWLVRKCHSDICDAARRQIPFFALAMLAFLVIALAHALLENLPIMRRWIDRPYLFLFPTLGAGAALVLAASILHHDDDLPFYAVALIFASAFGTLALSFWPPFLRIRFHQLLDRTIAPHRLESRHAFIPTSRNQGTFSRTHSGAGLLLRALTHVCDLERPKALSNYFD